jgi:RNA polymerase sigma-70 factor (ECF subfamily)
MARGRPLVKETGLEPDEQRLIEAAQKDPARFAELYEVNFDRVYSFIVRRIQDRSEAQDLTSEVFHQALANLGRFEWRGTPFAAWLFRIAANAIADRFERMAKEPSQASASDAAAVSTDQVEYCADVFRLVKELPADQRRVIEMRFSEEKSIREIAQDLGRSEGAVKQLQFRGVQNLRERMGKHNG